MDWLLRVDRPASRWDAVGRHLLFAVLSGGLLLASFLVQPALIPFRTCMFYNLTGYPCLSCGFTRGFHAMAMGRWGGVLHECPIVLVLFWIVATVFAWNAAAMLLGVNVRRGSLLSNRRLAWCGIVLLLAALANWIYRLAMGLS